MGNIASSINELDNAVLRDTLLHLNDESTSGFAMILLDSVERGRNSQSRGREDGDGDWNCEKAHAQWTT